MEIKPFYSVGVLVFGDDRKNARSNLNSKYFTFTKYRGETETDSFDEIGLHLYYDSCDRLELVEAFHPADISFQGVRFIGQNLDAVKLEMEKLGFTWVGADVGVDFPEAGIALTAPTGVVQGVSAHRKDYYIST